MEGIWKTIMEGDGHYKISKYGEIQSFMTKNPKILKWQRRENES